MMILKEPVSIAELTSVANELYGDMVKAVADVKNNVIAIDAELHSDLERMLLEEGSEQENLWGFNIYPEMGDEDFVEFDSLINIRPRQNNRSRSVEDENLRSKIIEIINKYIIK